MTDIVEIYPTLQGEGLKVGVPSILIRLSGCNLHCKWCDTSNKNTPNLDISLMDITDMIKKYPTYEIIITGGEPLLDQPYLKRVLQVIRGAEIYSMKKLRVTIETNCTIFPGMYIQKVLPSSQVFWSVSPKLQSSGETYSLDALLKFGKMKNVQFKFVVADATDLKEATHVLCEVPINIPIIFQPVAYPTLTVEEYLELCEELVGAVMELGIYHDWRVLPQWHKLIWGMNTKK